MGVWAGGGRKFVRAISQKLTFDLAVVTLTKKILSGLYLGTVSNKKLILGRDIG